MLIRENKELPQKVIDVLRKKTYFRGKWHLTDLLRCPRITYRLMTNEQPKYTDAKLLTFARGKAHHSILEVFPLKEVPRNKDGINGAIDMIGDRITEIFTTTVSVNRIKSEEDVVNVFSYKVDQLMSYCYMSGELEGDLLVFFLMGDYSRFNKDENGKLEYIGIEPELKSWTLYFEESEMKETWDGILRNKDILEYALKVREIPKEKGEEHECKYCVFGGSCEDSAVYKRAERKLEETKRKISELEWIIENLKESKKNE